MASLGCKSAPLQIQYLSKFSSESFCKFQHFVQDLDDFHNFRRILRRFGRTFLGVSPNSVKNVEISSNFWISNNSDKMRAEFWWFLTEFRWQWFECYGPAPTESYIPGGGSGSAAVARLGRRRLAALFRAGTSRRCSREESADSESARWKLKRKLKKEIWKLNDFSTEN